MAAHAAAGNRGEALRTYERCRLVLAEEYSRRLAPFFFAKGAEFTAESPWSTWWRPTVATWLAMVRCAGFEQVRRHAKFSLRFRAERGGVPHVVVHAEGPASS